VLYGRTRPKWQQDFGIEVQVLTVNGVIPPDPASVEITARDVVTLLITVTNYTNADKNNLGMTFKNIALADKGFWEFPAVDEHVFEDTEHPERMGRSWNFIPEELLVQWGSPYLNYQNIVPTCKGLSVANPLSSLNASGALHNLDGRGGQVLNGTWHVEEAGHRRVRWYNGTLNVPNGGCAFKTITVRPLHSGKISYSIELDNIGYLGTPYNEPGYERYVNFKGELLVTHIAPPEFYAQVDELKIVMFWGIFNETSEDEYTSGSLTDVWAYFCRDHGENPSELASVLNGYCSADPNYINVDGDHVFLTGVEPDYPTEGILDAPVIVYSDFRNFTFTSHLREGPGCDMGIPYPHNPLDNPAFWQVEANNRPRNLYLSHCEDHRYLMAQTMLNGLLNYQRNDGTGPDQMYLYFASNLRGTFGVGKDEGVYTNTLWKAATGCALPYSSLDKAVKASGDNNWQPAIDWLNAYSICQLSQSNPAREAIYRQAYYNIMREIDRAVADFACLDGLEPEGYVCPSIPDVPPFPYEEMLNGGNSSTTRTLDSQRYGYIDPTNGAFTLKGASILTRQGDKDVAVTIGSTVTNGNGDDSFFTVTTPDAVNGYATHIGEIANYVPTYDSILQPVLRIERGEARVDPQDDKSDLRYYYESLCKWTSNVYQHSGDEYPTYFRPPLPNGKPDPENAVNDMRHYPR